MPGWQTSSAPSPTTSSELPPIQRRALEAALLGEAETQVDERAVAAAFLAAPRLLAADGTLLHRRRRRPVARRCFAHSGFRFALSRLDDEPIATLPDRARRAAAWLRRSLPETRLATVELAGLSIGALHELFRTRLDVSFPRPTLVRP